MQEQQKHENLTYLVLWGMLFIAPVLSLYVRTVSNDAFEFRWDEVLMVWKLFAIYLVIFLFHNFFLAHLLVYKQKRAIYFSAIAIIIAAFVAYQCTERPKGGPHGHHDKMHHEQMADRQRPPMEDDMTFEFDHEPPPPDRQHPQRHRGEKKPPVMVGEHDIIALIVLILMLGMNIGIKLYFKSRRDTKIMAALEKENLEQQLEYLRYQINPHFFMNTLNNIHALVDIDPERAKSTILELSKMMRFILYEGDKKGVPLTRELDFIRNYVTLMRLRYTDKVDLQMELPTEVPDYEIPPLMLITFIENAFKHGISYQRDSFIHVRIGIEGTKLRFTCSNSKADKPNQEKGGVGLTNVKQRLNLIYGDNFTLNIQDNPDTYNVKLEIPLT
ncbi:MAG: histidine kinase [Prevotella sp.]|nr:histidine kinase [Prevotella sp.]